MVDGEFFDKIDQVGQIIRSNKRPFGGLQVRHNLTLTEPRLLHVETFCNSLLLATRRMIGQARHPSSLFNLKSGPSCIIEDSITTSTSITVREIIHSDTSWNG
jgi:hypothetical protein